MYRAANKFPFMLPSKQGFLRASVIAKQKYEKISSVFGKFVSVLENEKHGTATVILQRPPVNSLNLELLQQLSSTVKELEKKKIKGFILSSSSPTIFSGGLDIMEMYQAKEERFRAFWQSLQEMWMTLYLTPLVTVAAITGHAPAAGCMLSLSCDYRIMMKSYGKIGMNETLLGIVAPKWFRSLLINTVGYRIGEKSLNLGTLYTPEEALALGLVDELASDSQELMEKAQKKLALWVKISEVARQTTKVELRKPLVQELHDYKMKELEEVLQFVMNNETQNELGKYMEMLKKK